MAYGQSCLLNGMVSSSPAQVNVAIKCEAENGVFNDAGIYRLVDVVESINNSQLRFKDCGMYYHMYHDLCFPPYRVYSAASIRGSINPKDICLRVSCFLACFPVFVPSSRA